MPRINMPMKTWARHPIHCARINRSNLGERRREMLGIDFGDNSIRVVHLIRRGSGFALLGAREIAFTPEQSSDPE